MKNIMVLFGGISTEHEISQRSAYNIIKGLREAGLKPLPVGITRTGEFISMRGADEVILEPDWDARAKALLADEQETDDGFGTLLDLSAGVNLREFFEALAGGPIDVCFPAVHGVNCEDGALQGVLEMAGIPYVGSEIRASAICMDKCLTKKLISLENIPQLRSLTIRREAVESAVVDEVEYIIEELGLPCFVKPANGGSSVGAAKAFDRQELKSALENAARYDNSLLVEEYIQADELEVAVLGNAAPITAAVGQIALRKKGAYYDYANKYLTANGANVLVPAPITEELAEKLCNMALRIYQALDCRGMARVDFFMDRKNDSIYFNEINTIPGFTAISVYPQAFACSGIELPELLLRLCDLAIENMNAKQRLTNKE